MKLKREKVRDLISLYYGGNYTAFGKDMGVDPSHICRFVNSGVGGGIKIVGAVLKLCKTKNIDFYEYIEL